MANIGLGLSPIRRGLSDGSATSHIQEIARQKSNITRRNLAVGIAIVNEAERSVAAALMYHCGLIEDTEEYVKTFERASDSSGSSSSDDDDNVMDELPKPPELLVRLWKNARRSRKWLKEQKYAEDTDNISRAYDLAKADEEMRRQRIEMASSLLKITDGTR